MDDVGGQLKMAGDLRCARASEAMAKMAAAPARPPWLPWGAVESERLTIAYVLAAGMGFAGIHRLFLGRTGSGIAMMAVGAVGGYASIACCGWVDLVELPAGWSWDAVGLVCFFGLLGSTLLDLATMHRWKRRG